MTQRGELFHLPADTGRAYWGPGDRYTFLVTGEQSGGVYFVMEALVPPGGGPPPHIHRNEDETFYVVEGRCRFLLGDRTIHAAVGDYINVPRGTVHCFHNDGTGTARLILTFTPAGLEKFFEETLEPARDRHAPPPQNVEAVVARYVAAAPKYGLDFLPLPGGAAAAEVV